MTDQDKIAVLRHMLDDDEIDAAILNVYLEIAAQKILNRMYPFKTDYEGLSVPDKYAMIQLNIACYQINKRGAEGEIQHIENNIHRNYGSADIPEALLKDVTPFCQVVI